MATKCTHDGKDRLKTPRVPYKMRTVGVILDELAKLYREARHGMLDPSDATKLASILELMRRCIVDNELEARVKQLEASLYPRDNVRSIR